MKLNKIHFFKEKKWIMAWWFKRSKTYLQSEEQMLKQWNQWWKNDFINTEDKRFQDAYEWVRNTVKTMTMDEIKKARYDIADTKPVSKSLQRMANDKGYYIKKAATSRHPLAVSGYKICKSKRDKKSVCGEKFDLTVKQVKEFLESR